MTDHLEPCPFCGMRQLDFEQNEHGRHYVMCLTCGCEGPWTMSKPASKEDWNRRAPAPQPAEVCRTCGYSPERHSEVCVYDHHPFQPKSQPADRVREVQEAGENLLQWYDAIVGAIPNLSDKSEVRKAEARFRNALAALQQAALQQTNKAGDGVREVVETAVSNVEYIIECWLADCSIECRGDDDCDHCAALSDLHSIRAALQQDGKGES